MAGIHLREIHPAADGVWQFRDSTLTWRPPHKFGATVTFDPFPGYPHDPAVAVDTTQHVEQCFPPLWDVNCYLADREEVSRSNGHSNIHGNSEYVDGEWVQKIPTGMILMSGKRIPPHPALTRYLVAHEYGHNVEWMLAYLREGPKHLHSNDVVSAYAKMRGLPEDAVHHGEGSTWHDSATEIFACDFRVIVCDVETGFWPHPGIPQPHEVPALNAWWAEALADVNKALSEQAAA